MGVRPLDPAREDAAGTAYHQRQLQMLLRLAAGWSFTFSVLSGTLNQEMRHIILGSQILQVGGRKECLRAVKRNQACHARRLQHLKTV
jgi:hypothetical protein